MKLAAIEGGGTTWVVAITEDKPDNIIEREVFATETPEITLSKIRNWLKMKTFDSIGIACFGPVDANTKSQSYGFITSTPKPNWGNTDVLKHLGIREESKDIPFQFDTDVNAPAIAEFGIFKDNGYNSCAYITVGTGIGVGLVINGESVKGLMHPEGGHILIQRDPNDNYPGSCPFHSCCLEGMCNSISLAARAGCSIHDLPLVPDDSSIWSYCAQYLAQLCVNLILIASPEHISIGGGILNRPGLLESIQRNVLKLLNGYIQNPLLTAENIDKYITFSKWGNNAGIVGAAHLALRALENHSNNSN